MKTSVFAFISRVFLLYLIEDNYNFLTVFGNSLPMSSWGWHLLIFSLPEQCGQILCACMCMHLPGARSVAWYCRIAVNPVKNADVSLAGIPLGYVQMQVAFCVCSVTSVFKAFILQFRRAQHLCH